MARRIAVVSGGFDPVHSGHIQMMREARANHDRLIVLVNSEEWLVDKKGYAAMPIRDRMAVLDSFSFVDDIIPVVADQEGTVSKTLIFLCQVYQRDTIVFCNGGDRPQGNVPEQDLCSHMKNLEFAFGVGGDFKMESSSSIWGGGLRTDRLWGHYIDHLRTDGCVFKTLHFRDGEQTSDQMHEKRTEVWHVQDGTGECVVNGVKIPLAKGSTVFVDVGRWHFIRSEKGLVVNEMQYGYCDEEDIKRR